MMRKSIQRGLVWLIALMAAFVIAPGAAFADSLAADGILSTQAEDTAPWIDWQDGDTIFSVAVEQSDGQIAVKDFTKAQMVQMAAENTQPCYYTFTSKGDAVNTVVVDEYVTVDQLLAAAEVTFAEGDTILCSAPDFTPKSATTYAEFTAERKFYPAFSYGSFIADGAEATPAIVALKWGTAKSSAAGTTAASLMEQAAEDSHHGALRNYWGKSEAEFNTDGMGGGSYVSGASKLTISKPFNIYTQEGKGQKTLVKSYYRSDLAKMAVNAADPADALAFLFNKNGWQVGATSYYVKVSNILADAFGAEFALAQNQSLVASASDGFSTYLPYEQFASPKYFYPATTSAGIVADGAEEVGTVLALTWETTQNAQVANMNSTAGEAKMAIASAAEADLVTQYRIFTGLLSADDPNTGGNRFATGPVEISIVTLKDIADQSISVSGVESSYAYTGEAIEPAVVVKDGDEVLSLATKKGGDYSVEYQNNVEPGTGTIVISGLNSFMGTRTIAFKIQKDLSKAKVTLDKASAQYTGKAQWGSVKSVVLDGVTLSSADYSVKAVSGKNAGSYAVTVTGIGNYTGTAKATFKITAAPQKISAKAEVSKSFTGKKSGKTKVLPKNQVINLKKLANVSAKTTVKYAKANKAGAAKIVVAKDGKITVKKGLKKGFYKVKVKLTAAANKNYKAAAAKAIVVTVTVK